MYTNKKRIIRIILVTIILLILFYSTYVHVKISMNYSKHPIYTYAQIICTIEFWKQIKQPNEIQQKTILLGKLEVKPHKNTSEIESQNALRLLKAEWMLVLKQYQMIESIKEKIASFQISEKLDMSKVIGFTFEELVYILKNAKSLQGNVLITDEQLIDEIALAVTSTVKDYPVNEIFAISVMSHETGYFTSNLLLNGNNFGGMLKSDGTGYKFETRYDGLVEAVKCINNNMNGNNTIYEINATYCPGQYDWSKSILSIMRTYTSIETKNSI